MLKAHLKSKHLILASGSPRRQELLKQLDIPFEIRLKPIEENYSKTLKHHQIPDYLAQKKAIAFDGDLAANDILITSDTIVWLNNQALGKPKTQAQAFEMLRQLSGQTHEVITSICLTSNDKQRVVNATTRVVFRSLSDKEIEYYINHFNPLDKAGAYGIQEWIGQIGIVKIEGSYYNVMGLPLDILYKTLFEF